MVAVYGVDDGIQIFEGQHRQHRAENLLAHDGVLPGHVVQQGWFNLPGLRVTAAAVDHLLAVDKPGDPVKMLLADDLAISVIVEGIGSVLAQNLRFQFFQQPVLHQFLAHNIVRGYAGLAAV